MKIERMAQFCTDLGTLQKHRSLCMSSLIRLSGRPGVASIDADAERRP